MSDEDFERFVKTLPARKRERTVTVEIDLSEAGYRRICEIGEALARDLPRFDIGQALVLVIEAGTSAVEQKLAERKAGGVLVTRPN